MVVWSLLLEEEKGGVGPLRGTNVTSTTPTRLFPKKEDSKKEAGGGCGRGKKKNIASRLAEMGGKAMGHLFHFLSCGGGWEKSRGFSLLQNTNLISVCHTIVDPLRIPLE